MKQFKVYMNPLGSYEAVKQGWSWPGFFFGIIWALFKKMWVLAVSILGAFFILGLISVAVGGDLEKGIDAITSIGSIVLSIVFGVNGNNWREKNLTSRGFDFKDTVSAANSEGAIALYVKEHQV